MKYTIRKTQKDDLPHLRGLFNNASAFLKEQGVDQWQNGYPSEQLLLADIAAGQSYVLLGQNKIVATSVLQFLPEEDYSKIFEGEWHSTEPCACIHRITTSEHVRGRGVSGKLVTMLEKIARKENIHYMRVDTHTDNKAMRHFLEKIGFEYCGVIYLKSDGAKRVAYDKNLTATPEKQTDNSV